MSYLRVANGAVAIELSYTSPMRNVEGDAHFFGTVIAIGNGVPWLRKGDNVAFSSSDATRVEPAAIVDNNAPKGGAARTGFYLVDQKHVHGVFETKADQSLSTYTDDMVSL